MPPAAHFHHQVAPREGPRQQDGVHCGQGAAGGETHALRARLPAQYLGRLGLQAVGKARLQPETFRKSAGQGLGDDRRVVTQDVGVVSLPKIQDAVSVLVLQPRPLSRDDARREGLDEPYRVAAAIHQVLCRRLVQGGRLGRVLGISLFQFSQQAAVIPRFHKLLHLCVLIVGDPSRVKNAPQAGCVPECVRRPRHE